MLYIVQKLPPTTQYPGGGAAVMLGDRPVLRLPATIDDPLPRVIARAWTIADALSAAAEAADPGTPVASSWEAGWAEEPVAVPAPRVETPQATPVPVGAPKSNGAVAPSPGPKPKLVF